jgi:hemerythrin-like domain-containing protein
MCEHCGCRGVEPIAELMDEHLVLLDLAGVVRRALAEGARADAVSALAELEHLLGHHVGREERGIFRALKDQGDFVEEVDQLEAEHVAFDSELTGLGGLDVGAADFELRVGRMLDVLSEHVERENLGIFPVAVVTLGASGWETVARAHAEPHVPV